MLNNIRKISKEKKIPLSKVIKETKISRTQVHSYANGEATPNIINARKIAHVFKTSLEEVFPEEIKGDK